MCDKKFGIIYILKHENSVADQMDLTTLGISFINTCLNPIIIFYIFDINLGTQFLSILIMLQMTFEWFSSITGIFYTFCPVVHSNQLWFSILICHMWSSTFMYNLFIVFCKYNSVTMLIERCFQIVYPRKNILDYPRTVFISYCFALIYIIAINLRFTVMVYMDPRGECIPVGPNPVNIIHRKQLLVFGYLCLALLLILPAIIMSTCYLIMLIQYIKSKQRNKNFKGFNANNLQHILTLLVIIWSLESTTANILDMIVFYNFQNNGYTVYAQTIHSATELLRMTYFVSRTLSLFICVQPIRCKIIGHIQLMSKFFMKIFGR